MSQKNITLALSTLALLSASSMQADELLEFDALGTGEEIRAEILPVADADQNPQETPEQRKARKKREAEEKKNKGTKSTEEKCGKGSCGGK